MPKIIDVPGLSEYYLVNYDDIGCEQQDSSSPNSLTSEAVKSAMIEAKKQGKPVTDLFIVSHGWQSDQDGAKEQYGSWFEVMAACHDDIEAIRKTSPDFHPMVVGLHWPSKVAADEDLYGSRSVERTTTATAGEDKLGTFAGTLTSDQDVQNAIISLLETVDEIESEELDRGVKEVGKAAWNSIAERIPKSLLLIQSGLNLSKESIVKFLDDAPTDGDNKESAGMQLAYALSFWRMRERARQFGQGAAHDLIAELSTLVPDHAPRIHLVGHSFGCIVVSAAVAGASPTGKTINKVHSVTLMQGALSQFAFCTENPTHAGHKGEYYTIVGKIDGPLISTTSKWDFAVGKWYPTAAKLWQIGDTIDKKSTQNAYGALGAYGFHGQGAEAKPIKALPQNQPYNFEVGKMYNINMDEILTDIKRDPKSGAHCDLAHKELAHVVWEACATKR